jgi:hypothetical protein
MNTPQTHEDGDKDPAIVEIFILIYLFDHDDTPIGRCDDKIPRIFNVEKPRRTPVKVEYNSIADSKYGYEAPKWDLRLKTIPEYCCNHCESNTSVKELIGTFAVNSDFPNFP